MARGSRGVPSFAARPAPFLVPVDTHQHFWNPRRIPQAWMTGDHAAIARVFEPSDLEPLLVECGVESTVLVQSAASDEDTDYLFEIAGAVDWVGAIVGWCRLDDPGAARRRLDELQDRPKLRGIRHLIHQEPDPHWILRPTVAAGLALLEERGLLLELPAVYPNHLGDVPTLAARYPGLTIVVDHLGKPPLGTGEMSRWEELLRASAAWPNVHGKISGLNTATAAESWTADDLQPAVDVAVDAFGPARLVCGSDWPVALLNGTYERVWRETVVAVDRASDDSEQILEQNPSHLYRLATLSVPFAEDR
jgi:L-fucono-1,5-lactonase